MPAPIEPGMVKRNLHELRDAVCFAGANDKIVGFVLLQHQPHGTDIVPGESPIALRVEIAQAQFRRQPQLDARDAVRDLARDELEAATRRFVVEENPRTYVQVVALAIVDRDVVPVDLGNPVGTARVKRRGLSLRGLPDFAEHLAAAGLVETSTLTALT